MTKVLLTGVDGNLGGYAADFLLNLTEQKKYRTRWL